MTQQALMSQCLCEPSCPVRTDACHGNACWPLCPALSPYQRLQLADGRPFRMHHHVHGSGHPNPVTRIVHGLSLSRHHQLVQYCSLAEPEKAAVRGEGGDLSPGFYDVMLHCAWDNRSPSRQSALQRTAGRCNGESRWGVKREISGQPAMGWGWWALHFEHLSTCMPAGGQGFLMLTASQRERGARS